MAKLFSNVQSTIVRNVMEANLDFYQKQLAENHLISHYQTSLTQNSPQFEKMQFLQIKRKPVASLEGKEKRVRFAEH